APIEGGRPASFTVAELAALFAPPAGCEHFFSPRDIQDRLGCSESSAHRLIRDALEAGAITRASRGTYQTLAPTT
ncbi:MAG: hypothetical protein HGA45_38610, partial [Chloroflexales bacterium]|nr:hypothetical protein [Chloroflexales bacterium]